MTAGPRAAAVEALAPRIGYATAAELLDSLTPAAKAALTEWLKPAAFDAGFRLGARSSSSAADPSPSSQEPRQPPTGLREAAGWLVKVHGDDPNLRGTALGEDIAALKRAFNAQPILLDAATPVSSAGQTLDHDDLVTLLTLADRLDGWDMAETAVIVRHAAQELATSRAVSSAGQGDLRAALERARQEHARHDIGHQIGAWPNACIACAMYRDFAALATQPSSDNEEDG